MKLPDGLQGSQAVAFLLSQGKEFRQATEPNIEIENCFYCHKNNYHLRMEVHGDLDDEDDRKKDGLHHCLVCGKGGNLRSLRQHLGIEIPGIESRKEFGQGGTSKAEELPNIEAAHELLLSDDDAMEYLMVHRGFSRAIIERMKIGLTPKRYFREAGDVKALIYPYLVNGNPVFVHYRTLPDMNHPGRVPKAFSSPAGWAVPLYNGEVLNDPKIREAIFVEGEPNTIAALDHGVENICGVPGANFKKAEWLDLLNKIERIYICYDKDKVGQKAAQVLATRIGIEKCWKIVLPDFDVTTEAGETRKGKDLNEWFVSGGGTAEAFEQLKLNATLFDVDGVASSVDSLQEFEDDLNSKEGAGAKYQTPWESLSAILGFDEGDVIDILAPEKIGKLQPLSSLILTTCGWKRMGDLKVGDSLASIDGAPSYVTGVFPQGVKEIFDVEFADGRKTKAGAEHLWKVNHINNWYDGKEYKVYTTEAIAQEYHQEGTNSLRKELYVPLCSGDFGNTAELPFDPWMLGALIGDGSFVEGSPTLTSTDQAIPVKFAELLHKYGLQINAIGEHRERWANGHIKAGNKTVKQFGISRDGSNSNYLIDILRDLDLWGHTAESKFIPKIYLESSRTNRVKLLQGLMDTDGTASNRNGVISYCTISKQLAEDVVYLVRSLGGMAKIGKPQKKSFRYKGELRQGKDAYIIVVRLPNREEAFTLQRKLDRLQPRKHQPRLVMTSIRSCGYEEAQCIAVSHPSKLYITDDFIVTHNTTFAMNLVEYEVGRYGDDAVFICLEMTRAKMTRKWVSHKRQIADNTPKNVAEGIDLKNRFLQALPGLKQEVAEREGDLYFCYPKYEKVEDIYNLIRDIIRRYGVKWIVLDNLQRLCDTTLGSKNRTEHLSQISKVLSQIAKDYNVQFVRILQPHRIGNGRMVTTDNVDGASQIAKDCDCMITLHRNRVGEITAQDFEMAGFVQADASFSDDTLVAVGLSRYSSGGYTTLHCNGATSTFMEKTQGQIAKMQATANANVGYDNQLRALNIAVATSPSQTALQTETKEEDIRL
jgi:replicative DNA helicase